MLILMQELPMIENIYLWNKQLQGPLTILIFLL